MTSEAGEGAASPRSTSASVAERSTARGGVTAPGWSRMTAPLIGHRSTEADHAGNRVAAVLAGDRMTYLIWRGVAIVLTGEGSATEARHLMTCILIRYRMASKARKIMAAIARERMTAIPIRHCVFCVH